MPADQSIIYVFCMGDEQFGRVNKRSDALLFATETVTSGLLFRVKGGGFAPFIAGCRSISEPYYLPERMRLQRLLRDHAENVLTILGDPNFFTVVDTYSIAFAPSTPQGRSKRQIGKKGKAS